MTNTHQNRSPGSNQQRSASKAKHPQFHPSITSQLTTPAPGAGANLCTTGPHERFSTRAFRCERFRAGVTTASYRRFETTGKASLELLLQVTHALGRLDEFADLLKPPTASSIDELAARTAVKPKRKRGER